MQEYDLSQWVLFFFLYSFLGWIWESCYVSVRKHRWVNRGFMHGPMLPLYGSGAMVVLIVTIPVRDNILLVFLMGMIGATILEYFTGITMERLFHVRYWDYRNLKFNVRGYICPLASLCWGAFSILMVKVVHIPFEHMVLLIPVTIADILAFVKSLDPHVISRDRATIAPYELDIVSRAKSLAIEVNGTYWHSERAGKDRLYHKMKRLTIEKERKTGMKNHLCFLFIKFAQTVY